MTEDDLNNEVSNDNTNEEATEPPTDTKIETVDHGVVTSPPPYAPLPPEKPY